MPGLQEKREALKEITQKVDFMQQVEQWQVLQDVYGKVIAWQQVRTAAPLSHWLLTPLISLAALRLLETLQCIM